MTHNTSYSSDGMGEKLEEVVDGFIREGVECSSPLFFPGPTPKKSKLGDEATRSRLELYYYFYKALSERKLLNIWMQKATVEKYRWRLDEIDALMSCRGREGPSVQKVEKAMHDLLEELTGVLYSELF